MWMQYERNQEDIIKEIEEQTDRGAAIVAASFLEDRLSSAIKSKLVDDKEALGKIFTGTGPLSTFSSKIDFAYLLGIYPRDWLQSIHRIRKIRNIFAHTMAPITFETQQIRDICKNFPNCKFWTDFRIDVAANEKPNMEFVMNTFLENLSNVPDSPRNRFMNMSKLYLFSLSLLAAAGEADRHKASNPRHGEEASE